MILRTDNGVDGYDELVVAASAPGLLRETHVTPEAKPDGTYDTVFTEDAEFVGPGEVSMERSIERVATVDRIWVLPPA